MFINRHTTKLSALFIATLAVTPMMNLKAGADISSGKSPVTTEPQSAEPSIYEKIWGLATLYKNDENPFIEEFKLKARYQGQYHWLDSAQGNENGWEDRRFRIGFSAKLLKDFEFSTDISSTDGFDPFYGKLTELFLKWKPSDSFNLWVGKFKPQISWDWLRQDEALQTFERVQLFNQTNVDRVPGVAITGKTGKWSYEAGIYSNEVDKEFGSFAGGWSTTIGFGYDFKSLLGTEQADWRIDWLHSEIDQKDTLLNQWSDSIVTGLLLQEGRFGLTAEVYYFSGEHPSAFGFYLQPTFDIIPKTLQLVARYSFANGDGPDSLSVQKRYELRAPEITAKGKGDQYQSAYLGVQYFIYGDKLKLLAGAEYAHMSGGGNGGDYSGWTYLTGVRFSF